LSEDTLGLNAGPDSYTYVGNNPALLTDPSGELPAAGVGVALAGGGTITGWAATGSQAGPLGGLIGLNIGLLINDASGAYDLGVAYGWWGQPKPKKCDDDCGALFANIEARMGDVLSRYAALQYDPLNLYNLAHNQYNLGPNAGTWVGHQQALSNAQRGLRNAINAAKAKGCPIPPQAEFLAEVPVPSKPEWRK